MTDQPGDPSRQGPTDPPPYGEQPYPPYPQQQPPYGQYGQYGQPPWGQPAPQQAWGQPAWQPQQDHPQATSALVWGIVTLVGGLVCWLPVLGAPYAWVLGRRVVREIDASGGRLGGRASAQAGTVMGIIGTVLLVLAVLAAVVVVVLLISVANGGGSVGSTSSGTSAAGPW